MSNTPHGFNTAVRGFTAIGPSPGGRLFLRGNFAGCVHGVSP